MKRQKFLKFGLVLIMLSGILTGCGTKSVDATDGLTLDTGGYNGYGYVSVDSRKAMKKIQSSDAFNANDNNNMAFWSEFKYEIQNQKRNYSNGDKVVVKAVFNDDEAKKNNISISNSKKTFTVKGLKKVYKTKDDFSKEYLDDFTEKSKELFESKIGAYDGYYQKANTDELVGLFSKVCDDGTEANEYSTSDNGKSYLCAVYPGEVFGDDDAFLIVSIGENNGKLEKCTKKNMRFEDLRLKGNNSEEFSGKTKEELQNLFLKKIKKQDSGTHYKLIQ